MIRFLNVTCKFPNNRGVEKVSFAIERGDFVLLSGSTGAGKTTILRLIYLDLTPTSGQMVIEGQFSSAIRSRGRVLLRRKLGLVFPEPTLLVDRTIMDNIALPLRIAGESRHRTLLQVNKLLFRFGLQSRSHAFPGEISSGEQKKAAIARALVNRPFILLADEPLANIDSEAGAEIVEHLRQINAEGTTILAATHLPQAFQGVAKRLFLIKDGKLTESNGYPSA